MEQSDYRGRIWQTIEDLILHTEMKEAERLHFRSYFCPCRDCYSGKCVPTQGIKQHLAKVGHDPYLMKSVVGRDSTEGYPKFGAWVMLDFIWRDKEEPLENRNTFFDCHDILLAPVLDEEYNIHEMFMDAFRRSNELHE